MPPRKRKRDECVHVGIEKEDTKNKCISKVTSKKDSNENPSYEFWLIKSEPESRFEKGMDMKFSIDDLKESENQTACWDGVRNYQARNFLRDQMKCGHKCFFYHSNCKEPGIAGICEVVKEGYPDHTQFDQKNPHFDSASKVDNPRWFMVDVRFIRMTHRFITLKELKSLHMEHKFNNGPLKNLASLNLVIADFLLVFPTVFMFLCTCKCVCVFAKLNK